MVARSLAGVAGFTYDEVVKQTVVTSNPEVLGGTPVFAGTRVPVHALLDHLKAGDSVRDFLEGFHTVRREQVIAFLEQTEEQIPEMVKPR